ncbi:MAG: hypothetical protein RBR29_01175 [Castellaniella sp.]|uniref:DUF2946 family protein n=1 Tax=Castellaniella sp. TaxID=1955812 RepID=UPI002A36BC4B|nr:DUF2946 family protein [Castellaniella sp.]MDY0308394.1 hypothetical protein [Castellaniella sp.]
MHNAGKRTRGWFLIHWLLVLGLWLQVVGPVFAGSGSSDPLRGLQIVACTPAGMVFMDLSSDPDDPDGPPGSSRTFRTGHCPLCATTPVPPMAATAGTAVPVAPWVQPVAGFDETPCAVRLSDSWAWPPVRCPPSRSC